MAATLIYVVAVISIAVYFLFFKDSKHPKSPPGPRGLPYVGSLFSLGRKPEETFAKWTKEYGPIVLAQLGRTQAVILSDPKLIKEAFNDPVFSGRPDNKAFQLIPGGKLGVVFTDGLPWVEQRRFTLRTLRDFGFGKKSMESTIMEEVQEIKDWIKKNAGKPTSVNRKFGLAVLNALWSILTSQRYDLEDKKLASILDTAQESFREAAESGVLIFFPELAKIFPGLSGWSKVVKTVEPMRKIFAKVVEDRLKDPGDEQNPRDFMDVYMNEIKAKESDPTSSFHGKLGIENMRAVVGDLHGAGSETTSTTLAWMVLYMMKFPDIQKKLHEEIDRVIGKSRLPSLTDKPNMPYSEATMMEVLRFSTILPMGVFHSAMTDTTFHGYFIPKDTMIIPNQHYVHSDPKIWGDPENFRPERFLSKDGKSILKNEALIPFTVGRRVCLGEVLARDELYLFATSIFQQFQVDPDPGNIASLEAQIGFLSAPELFTCIFKDRLE